MNSRGVTGSRNDVTQKETRRTRASDALPRALHLTFSASRFLSHAFYLTLLLLLSGCSNIGYYWQSVNGQLDIWRRERPIEEVLKDPAVSAQLKGKLVRVQEIRTFASAELGLPENQSYRSYADLGRQYVVWNVFAAPEFSMKPVQWCFLFAGCVGYRGYFAKADADALGAQLMAEGKDVYVGGVPAYSTLGWFADPVLNTFMHYPDLEIARLILHELAHQVLYVKDDTVFNESFAVAVETEGMRRWLAQKGDEKLSAEWARSLERRAGFVKLIAGYRRILEKLYESGLPEAEMRAKKAQVYTQLDADYRKMKETWGGFAGFDPWFARKPNNAQLISVGLYNQFVPAFEVLLARTRHDLPKFYAAVKVLAELPKEERRALLEAMAPGS